MWTTWEIKGLRIEGCILKKLSEVQKRRKLKSGRCVDMKLRPRSLLKLQQVFEQGDNAQN